MGATGGALSRDALQNVPPEARGPYIWLAVIWASYCGGLHGFNTANISGAMSLDPFVRDFRWSQLSDVTKSNYEGWAVSSMLLGQTAGVICAGPLGERRGRKLIILLSALFYTVGALLMCGNVGSYVELLVGRVLSGMGSGAGMVVGPIFISEIAPLELRGALTTFYNVQIMTGVAGSYWINYGSQEVIPSTSSWQWRTTLVLQMIPSMILFLGWPFFPESPRYLMLRGRTEAAKRSLSRFRGGLDESTPAFARELAELQFKVGPGSSDPQESGFQAILQVMKCIFTDSTTRHVFVFVLLIQTFFIMSGGNSITYYAPTILKSVGLSATQRLLFTGVYGLIKVFSVLLYALVLTDRYGRRPLLLIGSTINTICLIYLAVYLSVADISSSSSHASAGAIVAIVAICLFAVGYGFGWAPAFSLAASEICPTHLRGTTITLAFTYQNLLNFGITRAFPNMVVSMHPFGPFALFAGFTGLATVWVFLAFPECKGRSMEGMGEVFGLRWYQVGVRGSRMGREAREGDDTTSIGSEEEEEADKGSKSEHREVV